ncbi:MAG: lipoprotein-releasing system ATP-binding protein [Saprospiraceae bacterium]|jgi:lipoprotein-releasing system ATP-binding protein
MLVGKNISKSYGSLNVLNELQITVNKNEIVAIAGKSGSGKSTLLHILGTLDIADGGSIHIGDTDITKLSERDLARFRNQRIGFIFQFHHLLAEFTALENVCIPAYINGKEKIETEPKAKELLEYLGLGGRLDHKPSQLSGGEAQRVAIARALINDPEIVFADEPTGNLDDHTSEDLFELLLKLRRDYNQTFVLVTHSKEIAARCDRTLVLSNKQLA